MTADDGEIAAGSLTFDGDVYALATDRHGGLVVRRGADRVGYFWARELAMPVPIISWDPKFLALDGMADRAWDLRADIVAAYRARNVTTRERRR